MGVQHAAERGQRARHGGHAQLEAGHVHAQRRGQFRVLAHAAQRCAQAGAFEGKDCRDDGG